MVYYSAGVSGLTTALLLSQNPAHNVTIVAKHMPGDYDIEYTSPFAGANYLPLVTPFLRGSILMLSSMSDTAGSRWERNTWAELARLAKDVPEAGIHFQSRLITQPYYPGISEQSQVLRFTTVRRMWSPPRGNGSRTCCPWTLGIKTWYRISGFFQRRVCLSASTPERHSLRYASTLLFTFHI